ncbi:MULTISPECIES: hypothetical protein [Photorhabdus]|nr:MULTISPECIES: hypothetical protein [Photorhabdus]
MYEITPIRWWQTLFMFVSVLSTTWEQFCLDNGYRQRRFNDGATW